MTGHLSTRDFFWFEPNALLARYFAGHAVFAELDFVAVSETQYEDLIAAHLCMSIDYQQG